MSMQALLAYHIRTHGPIPTVRVSSAQAKGAAKGYSYWGAVRYEIRITRDGLPANRPLERASSDRRSIAGAERDLADLAEREGREECQTLGILPEGACASYLPAEYAEAIARHNARQANRPVATDSLEIRLLARLISRAIGCDAAESLRLAGRRRTRREGRWLYIQGRSWDCDVRYCPYGDSRDDAEFARETNQQMRRRIVEACGDRVLPPAQRTLVQQDDFGQLWEIKTVGDPRGWGGDRIERQVRVVCPSTGAVYWLPVGRDVRTAHEAVASTFGLSAAEYVPVAEA